MERAELSPANSLPVYPKGICVPTVILTGAEATCRSTRWVDEARCKRGPSMARIEASKVARAMKLGLLSDSPAARTLAP